MELKDYIFVTGARIKVQGAVKSQMDGKAGVLRAEIKIDSEHGNVEKKMEELADIEAKAEKSNICK